MPNNILFTIISLFTVIICVEFNEELIQVHIVFRHGERTPDLFSLYKNDPYANETYYPHGFGELTDKGKREMYRVGQDIRFRYDVFLGELYTPDLVYALASQFSRSKMSLQLVLAGLFPPAETEEIVPKLNWQPVPFDHKIPDRDNLLVLLKCQHYKNQFIKFHAEKNYRGQKQFRDLFKYISRYLRFKVNNMLMILALYHHFSTQTELGFILEPWTRKIFPETLRNATMEFYKDMNSDPIFERMNGNLLRTVIDSIEERLQKNTSAKKMHLYSAHDATIVSILSALGIFDYNNIPPYASYVIVEAVKQNNISGIKVLYQNYTHQQVQLLKIPGCGEFCSLDKVKNIIEPFVPDKIVKC